MRFHFSVVAVETFSIISLTNTKRRKVTDGTLILIDPVDAPAIIPIKTKPFVYHTPDKKVIGIYIIEPLTEAQINGS